MTTTTFLGTRSATIADNIETVFAGGDGFDDAAVRVAEYLIALAETVENWATTPQNHGGNPRTRDFVQAIEPLIEWSTR